MQKRRQLENVKWEGIDEQTLELLEQARLEREREAEEIEQLRAKRVSRLYSAHWAHFNLINFSPKSQRRRQKQISSAGLDEEGKALLEANAQERELMEAEIVELRERSVSWTVTMVTVWRGWLCLSNVSLDWPPHSTRDTYI